MITARCRHGYHMVPDHDSKKSNAIMRIRLGILLPSLRFIHFSAILIIVTLLVRNFKAIKLSHKILLARELSISNLNQRLRDVSV